MMHIKPNERQMAIRAIRNIEQKKQNSIIQGAMIKYAPTIHLQATQVVPRPRSSIGSEAEFFFQVQVASGYLFPRHIYEWTVAPFAIS